MLILEGLVLLVSSIVGGCYIVMSPLPRGFSELLEEKRDILLRALCSKVPLTECGVTSDCSFCICSHLWQEEASPMMTE